MGAKSVAISIIKKGHRKNFIALAEFTFSRVDSDRGGKHDIVWYDEVTYDPYFQSPVLDLSIINQTDHQCMLLFLTGSFIVCVHSLPLLCFSTWGTSS